MMTDREKICKGLECCDEWGLTDKECIERKCPYFEDHDFGDIKCIDRLHKDALALLKAQMPRVMTLEEAREAIRDGGEDVIFWEEKMFYNPHRLSIGLRIPDNEITFPDGDYAEFDVLDDPEVAPGYGSLFRLWTSKPSPEQMASTPWEGESDAE